LIYFLKFFFCFPVARVAIGVIGEGELSISLFYFLIGCAIGDTKYVVIILSHVGATVYTV